MSNINLHLNQRSLNQKEAPQEGALRKPKPPPPNPIPVLMVIFLRILVVNALSTFIVLDRRFQTQRSLWRVRMLTMKVRVTLLLTAKCQLLDLSSLIDLKIKIL